jgi:adenylate cyclase
MERRLSAIFAVDMVGYSRLIEADEVGTLERQKVHRKKLIDPSFEQSNGRIVKEMGDGLLVEFPSVVDAVQCAVTIQQVMVEREADVADDQRIQYRIGINLGDIVVEGDDIYGDGVNVAARLEQLAEPGGICISGTAYDQMRSNVQVGYESLGEVQVKNIERPIRAYKVLIDPDQAGKVIEAAASTRGKNWRWPVSVAAVLLIAILSSGAWWWSQQPEFEPADVTKFAFKLPDNPSIAVLPFDNLTGDPTKDYISDGLTENIIAELATVPEMLVIARNSVMTFKGKPVKVQAVAEQLGVRYVLEGSIQTDSTKIRVVAQLVDALNGRHLWAGRYDREIANLFEVQDEITDKIAEELEIKLTLGELARHNRKFYPTTESYRLSMQGRTAFQKLTLEGHKEAERLWTQFLEEYPESGTAHLQISWLHYHKFLNGIGRSKSPTEHLRIARQHAATARDLYGDKASSALHILLAALDQQDRNYQSAIDHVDRAMRLAPMSGDANSFGGIIKIQSGEVRRGVELLRHAMRLEPNYPLYVPLNLGFGLIYLSEYEEARSIAKGIISSISSGRGVHRAYRLLIAASALDGRVTEAKQTASKLLELNPDTNLQSVRVGFHTFKDTTFVDTYFDALRKAGLPEHPPN